MRLDAAHAAVTISGRDKGRLGIDDIMASDTHVASLVRWRVHRGEQALDIERFVLYRIEDGRIAEIWVRDWDQYAYDELFPAATD